jgi:alkylhydroperoxidase/carboxymuconolactone decarboxylase family protein YurZ
MLELRPTRENCNTWFLPHSTDALICTSEADGALPDNYEELIAVAAARKAGATEAELTESAMGAAALRVGAAVTRATHALGN